MKKQSLKKIITMGLIAASLIAVSPIKANAEWRHDSTGYWYTDGNSYVKDSWKQIDGKWYHFDWQGYMETGWYSDMSKIPYDWYFLDDDGSMVTGTKDINGVQNRFDNSGKWISYTDEEIDKILLNKTGKAVIRGSKEIVYDNNDNTDYSKFDDGCYTKDYIDNYSIVEKQMETNCISIEDNNKILESLASRPEDIIYIKNHKKVLSGLVGKDDMYYIEDGKFVRNAWRKIDDIWFYYKADGRSATSSMGGNVDGFQMAFPNTRENGGLDRSYPYKIDDNVERTYWIYDINREITEAEYNNYVNQGKIKFMPSGELFPSGKPDQVWLNESWNN